MFCSGHMLWNSVLWFLTDVTNWIRLMASFKFDLQQMQHVPQTTAALKNKPGFNQQQEPDGEKCVNKLCDLGVAVQESEMQKSARYVDCEVKPFSVLQLRLIIMLWILPKSRLKNHPPLKINTPVGFPSLIYSFPHFTHRFFKSPKAHIYRWLHPIKDQVLDCPCLHLARIVLAAQQQWDPAASDHLHWQTFKELTYYNIPLRKSTSVAWPHFSAKVPEWERTEQASQTTFQMINQNTILHLRM